MWEDRVAAGFRDSRAPWGTEAQQVLPPARWKKKWSSFSWPRWFSKLPNTAPSESGWFSSSARMKTSLFVRTAIWSTGRCPYPWFLLSGQRVWQHTLAAGEEASMKCLLGSCSWRGCWESLWHRFTCFDMRYLLESWRKSFGFWRINYFLCPLNLLVTSRGF